MRTMIMAAMLLASCNGSDFSSFDGQRSIEENGGEDSDAGDTGDTSKSGDGRKGSDTNGKGGGIDSDGDGDSGNGGIDGDSDNGSEGDLGNDDDSGNDDDVMTSDDLAKLPGVEVVQVGVNFEDLGLTGDRDYNDAVLCFGGKFKVDYATGNVVSLKNQVVTGRTSSIAGCKHTVRVEVVHANGDRETPISFPSNSFQQVEMNFKKGSKLEVFMITTSGCNTGVETDMHKPNDCKVEPDICRTLGN